MNKKEFAIQFLRFTIVGAFGTIIQLIILYVLTEFLGVYYILSSFLGYIVVFSFGFLLNKIWTFKESLRHKIFSKYIKFLTVCLFSLIINLILLYMLTEFFYIYYMISQLIVAFISLWVNFLGNKIWAFRK